MAGLYKTKLVYNFIETTILIVNYEIRVQCLLIAKLINKIPMSFHATNDSFLLDKKFYEQSLNLKILSVHEVNKWLG